MGGFIVAGIALFLAFLLLVVKVEPPKSVPKLNLPKKEKKKKEDVEIHLKNEETEQQRRTVRADKIVEMLQHVLEDGNLSEIQKVAQNGIDLKTPLPDGQSALMLAVKHNQDVSIIDYLVSQGIDINAVDDKGQTALILATTFNPNPDVILALLNNGADKNIKDKMGKKALDYIGMNFDLQGSEAETQLKLH